MACRDSVWIVLPASGPGTSSAPVARVANIPWSCKSRLMLALSWTQWLCLVGGEKLVVRGTVQNCCSLRFFIVRISHLFVVSWMF